MISGRLLFDITKAAKQKHKSGLTRVSDCLRRELKAILQERFVEVAWSDRRREFVAADGKAELDLSPTDTLLTSELFCEYEREGIEAFIASGRCRTYAIFHDAIPLQHPEFTWPHSVQRHPSYMKMLASFSGAFAVSQHSAILLEEYWQWLGFVNSPSVKFIQLGADGVFSDPSPPGQIAEGTLGVLLLGIIEKRKGQDLALEACEQLWGEGLDFELHIVGRCNPYFGKNIEKQVKQMARKTARLTYHGQLEDAALQKLFSRMHLMIFPSRAEGCGLPVLEGLWKGLPVLCTQLNSVRETSRFGGCSMFPAADARSLAGAMRGLLSDRKALQALTDSINTDLLPRWRDTAGEILAHIESESRR